MCNFTKNVDKKFLNSLQVKILPFQNVCKISKLKTTIKDSVKSHDIGRPIDMSCTLSCIMKLCHFSLDIMVCFLNIVSKFV